MCWNRFQGRKLQREQHEIHTLLSDRKTENINTQIHVHVHPSGPSWCKCDFILLVAATETTHSPALQNKRHSDSQVPYVAASLSQSIQCGDVCVMVGMCGDELTARCVIRMTYLCDVTAPRPDPHWVVSCSFVLFLPSSPLVPASRLVCPDLTSSRFLQVRLLHELQSYLLPTSSFGIGIGIGFGIELSMFQRGDEKVDLATATRLTPETDPKVYARIPCTSCLRAHVADDDICNTTIRRRTACLKYIAYRTSSEYYTELYTRHLRLGVPAVELRRPPPDRPCYWCARAQHQYTPEACAECYQIAVQRFERGELDEELYYIRGEREKIIDMR